MTYNRINEAFTRTTERRNIRSLSGKISMRTSGTNNGRTLVGRIVYNSRSEPLPFIEVLQPGCFTESLKTNEVFAYWSHDSAQPLSRQANGSLRIFDGPTMLRFEADLDPGTTFGANAISALRSQTVTSNSYGFSVPPDGSGEEWKALADGTVLRTIRKADLWEVSPVSVPAYSANASSIRESIKNAPTAIQEAILRDADGIADADDSDADEDTSDDELECTCSLDECKEDRCVHCYVDSRKDAPEGCRGGFSRKDLLLWNSNQVGSLDSTKERSLRLQSLLLRRL